jgi:hypothetical protein
MAPPRRGPSKSRLITSTQPSIYEVERELRREEHSLYGCLCSIAADSKFVEEISAAYPAVPLLANLRAGLWYCRQHATLDGSRGREAGGCCYFKSTGAPGLQLPHGARCQLATA